MYRAQTTATAILWCNQYCKKNQPIVVRLVNLHRGKKFLTREPGRDGKILGDHRQDGNDEVHRLKVRLFFYFFKIKKNTPIVFADSQIIHSFVSISSSQVGVYG